MATTTIPWGDGSGDNIYLTCPSASGDQTVLVSSDANTGISSRSKTVTFSATGVSPVTLTVNQEVALPYTPVDYIQTDGTAYIDTGIKGNVPRSMKMHVAPVAPASGNAYLCGCRKDSGNTRFAFLIITSGKKAGYGYANGVYISDLDVSDSCNNGTFMNAQAILYSGGQSLYIKQEGESSFKSKSSSLNSRITTNRNIYVFAWNNQGTASGGVSGTKIKDVQLYGDAVFGTLVFDGVACIYNGEYGLWDKVSNSFFGNAANSGSFTGPSI